MANELVHASQGTVLTQAEFEAVGLHVLNSQATGDLIYASSATQLSRLGVGTNGDFLTLTAGIPAWTSNKTTTIYIGDTANANMTLGLTINQGAADDQILAFKSSDVAHALISGLTAPSAVETDDYAVFYKFAAATGGLQVIALGENAAVTTNLQFQSYGGQADATKSTAGRALIELYASQHNGANVLANIAADGNVFGVRARVGGADVTVLLVDEDGDLIPFGNIDIQAGKQVGTAGVGSFLFNADGTVYSYYDFILANSRGILTYTGADNYFVLNAYNTADSARKEAIRITNQGTTALGAKIGFFGTAPVIQQVDARIDDIINSGDATTDGVIDALRDALILYGLIVAA